ncbi:hypothetical protein N0V82_001973 [Gnomoniopsis sp. IMI 355080]|nr:hypothetical protein N0V82_001973 [Gnomoniopsis sp. IMI 355080]
MSSFIFKIQEWHEKYGPIVRISPWEVHIADPEFLSVILANKSQFDKKIEWKYRFGIPHSTFDTIEHQHHRARRSAIAPFFSKQKIHSIIPYISAKAHRLCDRLEKEYKNQNKPLVLNHAFAAFSFDIITYYAFARSFEYMEMPGFHGPFTDAAKELANTLHIMGHFPWLLAILQAIPNSLAAVMNSHMGEVFAFHGEIAHQIRSISSGNNDAHKLVEHPTVFHDIFESSLAADEKTVERLVHEGEPAREHLLCLKPNVELILVAIEGGSIIAGGVETTATALSKALYYILERPEILDAILEELDQHAVFEQPTSHPSLAKLEALPYLNAVVNETLRLSIGISQRIIRKSTSGDPPKYRDFVIPKGVYFSVTTYYTHRDPQIWDEPHDFRPERWLVRDPKAQNSGEPLSTYLVPFGKGPRMCLGINLARAELFIGLAIVLKRCKFELFESTRQAVDMKADYFIPMIDPSVEGVKVLVK